MRVVSGSFTKIIKMVVLPFSSPRLEGEESVLGVTVNLFTVCVTERGGAVQGRDTLVRDTISKGGFVQGAQHPRIFGRGHIGRGQINPASEKHGVWDPMPELTLTSPFVHSNTFTLGNHMPESNVSPS